jgi:retron-type reverse transcriptase
LADLQSIKAPLPQGAPTSPALANLCAFNLDLRLQAAAESLGARYSRYADDLVFSGGRQFERAARRFISLVGAIALEEGFSINFRKTRVMSKASSQRVNGIVVNEKLNVKRRERDQLKAILHNCVRHGPTSQNRAGLADFRAHLRTPRLREDDHTASRQRMERFKQIAR